MKKYAILALTLCIVSAIATSALALRWPDNEDRRVGAMGGATLAIEDESTDLNSFNHQNTAGMAFLPKMNRIDMGLGITSTEVKTDYPTYTKDMTSSGFEFKRPGAEYRGLTYWLNDNLIVRVGIEFMTMDSEGKFTPQAGTGTDDKLSFFGLGGGASVTYKFDMGLALAAGFTYTGGSGTPDPLTGVFNVLAPYGGTTDKLDVSVSNLDYTVAAAYQIPLGAADNKLNLGLFIQTDDNMPAFSSLTSFSGIDLYTLNDYGLVADIKGNIVGLGDVSIKQTYAVSPMTISGEAIYDMGKVLAAGVLFDAKTTALQSKTEYTGFGNYGPQNTDYKAQDLSNTGITPEVKAHIALSDDMALLPGVFFTTLGSGTTNTYSLNAATADVNDTFESSKDVTTVGTFGIGLGLQALAKQLQLGLQFESGADSWDYTTYAPDGSIIRQFDHNGNLVDTTTTKLHRSNIRVGAEYWVLPMFALRAGFATLATTTVEGYYNTTTNQYEDSTLTSNHITFGAGLSLPEGLTVDLMVELISNSTTPVPDPKPTIDGGTNVFLGTRIPI